MSLRLRISLAVGVGACICIVAWSQASAASSQRLRPDLTERAWISSTLAHMTLPEEVGQLFEVNGFGSSVRDRNSSPTARR